MGGVFNTGNTNNIVKINKENISTQKFMDYLNNSKINQDVIRNNLNKNILEELLSQLVSQSLLNMEIKDLKLTISDKSLTHRIKKNENFLDEKKKFSRVKYEKFLLENNMNAYVFEKQLKDNDLKKKLFSYISGGIKSPSFLTNKIYIELNTKLEVDYFDLSKNYKNDTNFSDNEIELFVKKNSEDLKEEFINFSYLKLKPSNLIGSEDFNDLFFKEIDKIENKISNGEDFKKIISNLKIKSIVKNNYIKQNNGDKIELKIYDKRKENKTQIIEESEFFVLYNISSVSKILPKTDNEQFKKKIINILKEKNKYEFHKSLQDRIKNEKFNQTEFDNLGKDIIQKKVFTTINDNTKFSKQSVGLLYKLPKNSFTLVADKNDKIYLAKINKFYIKKKLEEPNAILKYNKQANIKMRDSLYSSYDYFLNDKYKISINQKTLERVKNYFE